MQHYGELAGIPKEKRRFHALRHASPSIFSTPAADVVFVRDRLGHANIQNTMVLLCGTRPLPGIPRRGGGSPAR